MSQSHVMVARVLVVVVLFVCGAEAANYEYDNCEDFCESGSLTQAACTAESNCEWEGGGGGLVYYCSNDSEAWAEAMGGILCPEGPGNTPRCPNGLDCECSDSDGSCTNGDDDWSYRTDGSCWSSVGSIPCDPDPENDSNSVSTPASSTPTPGESCADVCPVESNVYEGKCGWFTRKNDKKWCTSPFYTVDICCSGSSDDCCVLDEGRVAGVAVGIFVVISLSVIACCYCCKCCCFNYRRKQFSPAGPAVVYVTQPGVQMQQR